MKTYDVNGNSSSASTAALLQMSSREEKEQGTGEEEEEGTVRPMDITYLSVFGSTTTFLYMDLPASTDNRFVLSFFLYDSAAWSLAAAHVGVFGGFLQVQLL